MLSGQNPHLLNSVSAKKTSEKNFNSRDRTQIASTHVVLHIRGQNNGSRNFANEMLVYISCYSYFLMLKIGWQIRDKKKTKIEFFFLLCKNEKSGDYCCHDWNFRRYINM